MTPTYPSLLPLLLTTVARKAGGHYVDPNQELIALGMTNLMCSLFHGFPVTGTSRERCCP